ncbi:hypothetical protein PAP_04885 [Palaeococcus pacificus DY20341]|uniref:DUF998 domain-containing protein n=1 Tax=Palaeococcus pacificus DY20341 TaxID=1343739 RepID=A0A075LXT9_9EURY|nr:DUF998 domain-containing protein [Palaeococcus pacificus]AIF69388.1 hypothetical protein PAP_04885 [Palaeococcus pacificus DY20341]
MRKDSFLFYLGVLIPIISLGGIFLSIYKNPWFSLTQNALSDMGSIHNPIGYIFNSILIITGIMGVIFGTGTFKKHLTTPLFAFGMVCLIFVGIFPEEYKPHAFFAVSFYILILLDMFIEGINSLKKGEKIGLFWVFLSPTTFISIIYLLKIFEGAAIPELVGAFAIYAWIYYITYRLRG